MEVEQTSTAPRKSIGGGEGAAAAVGPTRSIKIHPLGIIGISDHHTRVVTGGSALPPNAPVVGLLFGYYSNDRSSGSGGKFVWCVFLYMREIWVIFVGIGFFFLLCCAI